MLPKVQNKRTYKEQVKLYLARLKKLLMKTRTKKQEYNNTSNSNTYKGCIKSELERFKQ